MHARKIADRHTPSNSIRREVKASSTDADPHRVLAPAPAESSALAEDEHSPDTILMSRSSPQTQYF
jgi:hypothetical protein